MKVILLQEVKGVGHKDSIVDVAEGYVRNYLLPMGYADIATATLIDTIRNKKAIRDKKRESDDVELKALADRLKHVRITVAAAASSKGTLFGSVTAAMVRHELARQGYAVPESSVSFGSPIDRIGNHTVLIKLTAQHAGTITVTVVKETRHA